MNNFKLTELPIKHVESCLVTMSGKISQSSATKHFIEKNGQPYYELIVMEDNTIKSYLAGKVIQVHVKDIKLIAPNAKYAFVKLVYAHKLNLYSNDFICLVWW